MEGNEFVLYIGTRPHFGGRTHQYPHLPDADFPKELLLLGFVGGAVDKGDLLLGYPTGHKFVLRSLYTLNVPSLFGVDKSQNTNWVRWSFWVSFQIW